MTKRKCLAVVVSIALSPDIFAGDPYVDINTTMYKEGEVVYISCAFDTDDDQDNYVDRVASVCAKSNASPNQGYVQYRYGVPTYDPSKGRLDMQYPQIKNVPASLFRIYKSTNPESFGTALRFTNGQYMYSFESFDFFGYRVVVRKQGSKVFDKRCTLPGKNYLVDSAFKGIEVINIGENKIPEIN